MWAVNNVCLDFLASNSSNYSSEIHIILKGSSSLIASYKRTRTKGVFGSRSSTGRH